MSIRAERVAGVIKESLGEILGRDFTELTDGFLTVTDVRVAPDLKSARVYVSTIGGSVDHEKLLLRLKDASGRIRSALGAKAYLKYTPALTFQYDDTAEQAQHLNDIFRQIHDDERSRQGHDPHDAD